MHLISANERLAAAAMVGSLMVAAGVPLASGAEVAANSAIEETKREGVTLPQAAEQSVPTSIAVTIKGRNASAELVRTLVALKGLKSTPALAAALQMSDKDASAFLDCAKKARTDSSGRVFDLARCAQVWPARDKAPELKAFEAAYSQSVRASGVLAFPAVRVSTFEYQEGVKPSQLPTRLRDNAFEVNSDGTLSAKADLRPILCSPTITFIEPSRCKVRVARQTPPQEPVLYVTQTGYRVEFLNTVTKSTGQEVMAALKRSAPVNVPVVADAKRSIGIAPVRKGSLLLQTAGPLDPQANAIENHFTSYWQRMQVNPGELELDAKGATRPPAVLLFDDIDDDRAGTLADWFLRLAGSKKTMDSTKCALGDLRSWHSDAAASQLVPNALMGLLNQEVQPRAIASPAPALGWTGYLLSSKHFQGVKPVLARHNNELMWYDDGVFADEGANTPTVGIVVYSDPYDELPERVGNAGMAILGSESRILVVSAGSGKTSNAYSKLDALFADKNHLQENCVGRSWPSCLGPHPRVIVVAPSELVTPAGSASRLFQPGKYILGRSTVKVTAFARGVPVLSPCGAATGPGIEPAAAGGTWLAHAQDGTSFAAPLVGLLLARLINVGDGLVKDTPEIAVWRLLSTVDPIASSPDARTPAEEVQYGQINVARALAGADEKYAGDGRATVYARPSTNSESVVITRPVVQPYPWNDSAQNVDPIGSGPAAKRGIEYFVRGVLVYTDWSDSAHSRLTSIDFKRVLRLARVRDSAGKRTDRFDMYYLEVRKGYTGSVVSVARGIQIGVPVNTDADSTGFCRLDDLSQAPTIKVQAQPSCLYAWSKVDSGFRPLDLSLVDDIVLPPFHRFADRSVAGIDVTDLADVTGNASPWRNEFCKVGARAKVRPLLKRSPTCA